MDHESVESGGHRCIGCWFEHGRGEDPGPVPVAVGCERLRGGDVLAVDVGHGGGFAHVGLETRIEYVSVLVVHPEGRHRNLGVPLAVHSVGEVGAVVLVAFRVSLHSVRLQDLVLEVVVIFGDHVSDRPSPVEQETLGLLSVVQNHSCQCWHPAEKIVAFSGLELFEHIPGPRLRSRLVAVCEEIFNATLAELSAGGIGIGLEVVVEIFSDGLRVELVNFKAGGFR